MGSFYYQQDPIWTVRVHHHTATHLPWGSDWELQEDETVWS